MNLYKNNIYHIFLNNPLSKNESLNDILKGTKSVLSSKNGFKNYIDKYSIFTKKITFKEPNITVYPLLKKESSYLIPIKKKVKNINSEDKKRKLRQNGKLFFANLVENEKSAFVQKYNKRFYRFMKLNTEPKNIRIMKKIIYEKNYKRYNSLFLDFFDKWKDYDNFSNKTSLLKNKNVFSEIYSTDNESYDNKIKNNKIHLDNININFNLKKRYNKLNYNENEIFIANYDEFIENKINYIKNNKIQNFDTYLESSFDDSNDKKIQLKLESIKIYFYPLENSNKNIDNDNSFSINLPLSYAFLFYYKDIDFVQKVLINILFFKKDFKSIFFKDDELYNFLKTLNFKVKEEQKKDEQDIDYISNFHKNNKSFDENNSFSKLNSTDNINVKKELNTKDIRKSYNKKNSHFLVRINIRKSSQKFDSLKKEKKLVKKIVHYDNKYKSNNNNNINKKVNLFYDEYYFIWETNEISYKIRIEMPKIYFLYEEIGHRIVTYCDKNLFLYLYKNNFINWDFYILNYIFSIKDFRKIILQFLSFYKDYSLIKDSINNKKEIKNIKSISMLEKNFHLYNIIEDKNNKTKNLFLINKKIFSQINEGNEAFKFFYSDSNLNNYILNFHSYNIKIAYKQLNPHLKWEFVLNFKHMKYLNEISKYENLYSFLLKILKTDFENGELDINLNIFDNNFNAKIFKTEKNDNIDEIILNDEINIEIKKPYVEIKKNFIYDNKLLTKEFNYIFLQNLNKIKMEEWPKNILEILKNESIIDKRESSNKNFFNQKLFKFNEDLQNHHKKILSINRSKKQKLTYGNYKIKKFEDLIKFNHIIRKRKSVEE